MPSRFIEGEYNDISLPHQVSQKGLVEADVMFESLKQEHIKRKSIPKRLNIVHNYCVHLEVQQARGTYILA